MIQYDDDVGLLEAQWRKVLNGWGYGWVVRMGGSATSCAGLNPSADPH